MAKTHILFKAFTSIRIAFHTQAELLHCYSYKILTAFLEVVSLGFGFSKNATTRPVVESVSNIPCLTVSEHALHNVTMHTINRHSIT